MTPRKPAASLLVRRVAGIVLGLTAATITVIGVSVATFGTDLDLIVPLSLFVMLGSAAVSLSRSSRRRRQG
jgi:hypothetical protein